MDLLRIAKNLAEESDSQSLKIQRVANPMDTSSMNGSGTDSHEEEQEDDREKHYVKRKGVPDKPEKVTKQKREASERQREHLKNARSKIKEKIPIDKFAELINNSIKPFAERVALLEMNVPTSKKKKQKLQESESEQEEDSNSEDESQVKKKQTKKSVPTHHKSTVSNSVKKESRPQEPDRPAASQPMAARQTPAPVQQRQPQSHVQQEVTAEAIAKALIQQKLMRRNPASYFR